VLQCVFFSVNYICICYNSGTLGSGLCICKFVALVKGSDVCVVLPVYIMESFQVCLHVCKSIWISCISYTWWRKIFYF